MRVLMISKACVSQSYRTKVEYLNQLDPTVEVGLVVPPKWGSLHFEPREQDSTYPLFLSPIRLNGRNHFHFYPELGSIIRRYRPDLLHIDEEHYSTVTYQATRIAKRLKIPSLFFTWQNIYKRYPWPFSAMEQEVFHQSLAAMAGNQEAQEVLRRKGFQKPIWVIPQFGTDVKLYQPLDKREIKKDWDMSGRFVIGYVGRLVEEKGLDDLWQASVPLLSEHPEALLLLVGSGPWAEIIQQRAESLQLTSQLRIIPWVSTQKMPEIMNTLDVLVLPSHTTSHWKEQFGRVLTEAMASEIAVIGSSSGEIPQVIGQAGLIVPEGSPTALFKALESLYDNAGLRIALGREGRQRVLHHYSQDVIAEKTLKVYHHLMSERSTNDNG
ncbi:MAG: glycosyltransferase family 4 protein [Sulfobacillus thermosulfidooxidans]|uniref:Glycosyltransferase family 4 protein n=1 Tax=Sulfobacillus thermosulfidooxidans TaxID=28034 RepID=A0A2T2X3A1_SULTH|nr:MAG: glycosyltransferase family 4 protein [Sulfobacillus thermosulfidooxidans]